MALGISRASDALFFPDRTGSASQLPPCARDPPRSSDAASLRLGLQAELVKVLPGTFRHRVDVVRLADAEGLTRGAELGVLSGDFALESVKAWKGLKFYLLVDKWGKIENYDDWNNKKDHIMEEHLSSVITKLAPFNTTERVISICRNYTTSCVEFVPDLSLDYIYVDARHDYLGVTQDLVAWWPKLRKNGIMSGHDFLDQSDVVRSARGVKPQRWDINADGTVDPLGRAVKGAVEEFFGNSSYPERYRQISVVYNDWPFGWVVRK